jgi:CRISPR system Cascade subunit CasE
MARVALDGERLFEFAKRRKLPTWDLDVGYAVHCALRELFGEFAPQPFALDEKRDGGTQRWRPVLGYTTCDATTLREHAQLQADPWLYQHLVDWNSLATKPMPAVWRVGQALTFTVRACPIVRTGSAHAHHKKGAEVDVYLVRCRERPEEDRPDREVVYGQWLREHFERHPGATVRDLRVENFQIERLSRKNHPKEKRETVKGRPDVTFTGTLEVTDPVAFDALLRRGVGRHRAFGFGMLLLKPARGG